MQYDDLDTSLRQSATIKLLRSQNVALILGFLYNQFKQRHQVTIPHSELGERLINYVELLQEAYPERQFMSNILDYLRQWADQGYLRRYYESGHDDPVYELTPDTERAIAWVEELQKPEFVGTESRFLRIFDLLQEIVTYSSEDVSLRLEQLEKEKARIQKEIDRIKEKGEVEQFSQTQIKERFLEANDVARGLLADFRLVEENFRNIAREIQAQQLATGIRKGQIVQHVLDADLALKESDQGRSFYAFWKFLMSNSEQERLQLLLSEVYQLSLIQDIQTNQSSRLRQLKRDLIRASRQIVASNGRLSEQLRKLLDDQRLAHARRVMELCNEIKATAVKIDTLSIADETAFMSVDGKPMLDLPMERPLWSPPEWTVFNQQPPEPTTIELEQQDMATLYKQFYVEEGRLNRQIEILLQDKEQVTLGELTAVYPLEKGLAELVTYLNIASCEQNHHINPEHTETILFNEGQQAQLPKVTFRKSR